jgi:hypothetical protein
MIDFAKLLTKVCEGNSANHVEMWAESLGQQLLVLQKRILNPLGIEEPRRSILADSTRNHTAVVKLDQGAATLHRLRLQSGAKLFEVHILG